MTLSLTDEIITAMPDPELIIRLMKKARQLTTSGKLLKDQLGYTEILIEELYTVAMGLYNKSQFNEAIEMFEELFYLDPLSYKICYGLGATAQQMGEWYKAIGFYAYAEENKPQAPEPIYFSAECAVQIGKEKGAADLYKKVVALCDKNPDYKDLKDRSQALADALEKRIKEGNPPLCLRSEAKNL